MFECGRDQRSQDWCNESLGVKWSTGTSCGLDILALTRSHRGTLNATLVGGEDFNVTKRCKYELEVATQTVVKVGKLPTQFVVNQAVNFMCQAQGGVPSPNTMQASLEFDNQERKLEVN